MKLNHKHFALELKAGDEDRTVEGWASTFGNKDGGNDIIVSGAFADSLKGRMPKMLWQHDTGELIGVWDTAKETDAGLYVKGRFADTPRGNEAYTLAKMGALDSMSIGYSTLDYDYDPKTGVRTLKKLELWEVSLVTFPMNEQAKVTLVKAAAEDIDNAYDLLEQAASICQAYADGGMEPTAEMLVTVSQFIGQAMALLGDEDDEPDEGEGKSFPTPRALERILREAGLSKSKARGFVSKGYPILTRREADSVSEIATMFNQFR